MRYVQLKSPQEVCDYWMNNSITIVSINNTVIGTWILFYIEKDS